MQFDPVYMLFLAPAMLLSFWASAKTQGAFRKYSKVRTANGRTGREAAALTYVTAAASSILQLLYFISRSRKSSSIQA